MEASDVVQELSGCAMSRLLPIKVNVCPGRSTRRISMRSQFRKPRNDGPRYEVPRLRANASLGHFRVNRRRIPALDRSKADAQFAQAN
jgi:hypothetical protein